MRRSRRIIGLAGAIALFITASALGACGGGSGSGNGSGATRTVLVDYRHDEFASSFLHYYPGEVSVRPGDTVEFKQTWTGEPHSVTLGKVAIDAIEFAPKVEQYESAEAALAAGESPDFIDRVKAAFAKLPGMTADGFTIYQPGAQPCFVQDMADVPDFSDGDQKINYGAKCPTAGKPQPAFNGQALYNSGFIPPTGKSANSFTIPIATTMAPGTYKFFCNYHWVGMNGTIKVVAKDASIPSQQAVSRRAQTEVARDAKDALARVKSATKGDFDGIKPPLAGRSTGDENSMISINEFLPAKTTAKVGEKVTWTIDGFAHTVTFNVPKYFPIFTVAKSGKVTWDPKSYEAVGWKFPEQPQGEETNGPPPAEQRDAGNWDGTGGFHSSGVLTAGSTFSVTFTKAGTYRYACVLHPPMVGTLTVKG